MSSDTGMVYISSSCKVPAKRMNTPSGAPPTEYGSGTLAGKELMQPRSNYVLNMYIAGKKTTKKTRFFLTLRIVFLFGDGSLNFMKE